MRKTNSRKIRSNAIASLSNRSVGVLAMQSVPGGLLPLMADDTVLLQPFSGQPVSGPNRRLEQFLGFHQGKSSTETKLATGCGSTWHRECVSILNRTAAEFFRMLVGRIGIGLSTNDLSGN